MFFIIFLQITVSLFSKYDIQSITISQTDKKFINIKKNGYYKLQYGSKITINNKISRYYHGNIFIKNISSLLSNKNKFLIFQKLDLDDYVLGVLNSELDKEIPIEALKAFYLVVKNYTITHLRRHKKNNADFCDIAHCQLYYGNSGRGKEIPTPLDTSPAPLQGGELTYNSLPFGKKIYYKDKLAITPYSSSCGEYTCNSETIWIKDYPYLKGKKLNTILDKWSFKLSKKELIRIAGTVSEHGMTNLINKLIFKNGCVKNGENFRRKINQELGWNKIKSNVFTIKEHKNYYLIKGSGFGHNVGFCIKEAIELAKEGKNYVEILNYFFTDIEIR